jgi:hypothetical protein
MKQILFLLFLLMANLGNATEFRHWSDWTTAEKLEYTAFTLVNYTDFAQTERCISVYPKCKELNPFLGSKPNDATIAAAFLISQWGYYHLMGTAHYVMRLLEKQNHLCLHGKFL